MITADRITQTRNPKKRIKLGMELKRESKEHNKPNYIYDNYYIEKHNTEGN